MSFLSSCLYLALQIFFQTAFISSVAGLSCLLFQAFLSVFYQRKNGVKSIIATCVGQFSRSCVCSKLAYSQGSCSFEILGGPTGAENDCRSFAAVVVPSCYPVLCWTGF